MADITVTPTSVVRGTDAVTVDGYAGETIAAGKAVYKDPTSKKYLLADSNSATAAARHADGIALNGAAINQPIEVQTGGSLTPGATLTANTPYFLSDTPGGICPIADVGSGEYLNLLFISTSTSAAIINNVYTGVAN